MNLYKSFRFLAFSLPPEMAHDAALKLIASGCIRNVTPYTNREILETELFGLRFSNPVGLAAGFDKNATALNGLLNLGFGFIETGTVTPRPQPGNPKPRLFRLEQDEAIINRMGFNNDGVAEYKRRLSEFRSFFKNAPPIGANIGRNKDSANNADDYLIMLKEIYDLSDYITINISSPNTPNLRDLQKEDELDNFLKLVAETRNDLVKEKSARIPLLLKISPDIDKNSCGYISDLAVKYKIDGLIIGNTTISREGLKDRRYINETGGMSGRPLFRKSTEILGEIYQLTKGKIKLIGVGGVFSGEDAYRKIRAGASLVQLYTGFIYEGPGIASRINRELAELLHKDGFKNVTEAVGKR